MSATISLALFGHIYQNRHLLRLLQTQEPRTCFQKGIRASNTITPLKGTKTLVIAPYYDNRDKNAVRILGIVHYQEVKELYCWFHCRADAGYLAIRKADIEIHSDRFGFPYGAADFICPEPQDCDPKFVSIHWSRDGDCEQIPMFEIRNRHPQALSAEFTVCISTMFGNYDNVLLFIQSVEIYKLLGVQRVMVYKSDCSPWMERVLQHYISDGTVEVIPWTIASHLKVSKRWHHDMSPADIGYYGQLAALNDCIYRNMYRSKYLLLHDIDEIVLPIRHRDWKSMMADFETQGTNIGVFMFENYVFRHDVFDYTFNNSAWDAVPGINILQHIHREPHGADIQFKGRKMIINPRKVIQTSVHYVSKAYGATFSAPSDSAILYHCRKQYQANLTRDSLIKDTRIWKYNSSIIDSVNKVLNEI
ncbi:uncharacterized protein [Ambystoma mexicanum]|uniref:uncharacterized protein n=1 Tax=Ambystoma mexicanum TaxID=8296 RepID=UPI0037E73E61